MQNIVSYFSDHEFKESSDLFFNNRSITYSGVGNSSSKALIISNILCSVARKGVGLGCILWVTNDEAEMERIKKSLSVWGDTPVFSYRPVTEDDRGEYALTSEYNREKQLRAVEFVSQMATMRSSKNSSDAIDDGGRPGHSAIFVVPFNAVFQKFPNGEDLKKRSLKLRVDLEADVVAFIESIVDRGYDNADDEYVRKGQYFKIGDSVVLWPVNKDEVYRIQFGFDKIEKINSYQVEEKKELISKKTLEIYPVDYGMESESILREIGENGVVIDDELDVADDFYENWNVFMEEASKTVRTVSFTSFNEDENTHLHMHFYSVLKYRTGYDFTNDLRDKIMGGWKVLIFTKAVLDVGALLDDQSIPYRDKLPKDGFESDASRKDENGNIVGAVYLVSVDKEDVFPQSFQAPDHKVLLLTDVEISLLREKDKQPVSRRVFEDFLSGLKPGDYVVHSDHGIARFQGLDRKTVDAITREYLRLAYAENDKLFVPIDQADKVSKYIGSEESMPKLTRLGSAEWSTITNKVKKETQKIAKELLELYALRKTASGFAFKKDLPVQDEFEKTFPYEETPGQIKAIIDTKRDMESAEPMDRLVCGDVGFGKTEVAMRAAFKAVQDKKQVALISPITILADQHYRSFKKRMDEFHVRIEMMSRFKSHKEQQEILKKLEKGEVDIVIGTHRLLQPDVKFKDLGLVIVDEEQRFGVQQKEKLKELRAEVDILTLTATPIPRTLNICLNKLRDITTITTPPPGRLPIITEVRKYSPGLVRDAILHEVKRGGQVYFLHNRVQTIDSIADGLCELVPEATFGVAHGKLGSDDLEERILSFKDHKFDVLVSSTIIENGIDLPNANTLIVNSAERFGLAQLYQLRGRVGRSKTQAYAYFLYHGQRLHLDAKKRLRAIVEASELGSGFQIAMKDLEIRGAGDILGANQHGVINVVGVSHFIRMLNKAIEDLKAGRVTGGSGAEEEPEVSIELPIPAYIPDTYIVNSKDKISAYQRLAGVSDIEYLAEVREDLIQEFGKMPREVSNLFRIIELKIYAKKAGITNVRAEMSGYGGGGVVTSSSMGYVAGASGGRTSSSTGHVAVASGGRTGFRPSASSSSGAGSGVSGRGDRQIILTMGPRVKPANIISLLEYNPSWVISGTKLRIKIGDLGAQWFEELKVCMAKLSEKAKHGKR